MPGHNTILGRPLKVTVTGGGPVGLTFALLLESLMSSDVSIAVHDDRWMQEAGRIVWQGEKQQNAHFEDQLLALANEKTGRIQLIPRRFDPQDRQAGLEDRHALVICEGAHSSTRDYFAKQFGSGDKSLYSLGGNHLHDVILGLRVKSDLPDPMGETLGTLVVSDPWDTFSTGGEEIDVDTFSQSDSPVPAGAAAAYG